MVAHIVKFLSEKIWLITDKFGRESYDHLFARRAMDDSYIKNNFDATAITAGKLDSNQSIIGRMKNTLVTSISNDPVLPKLIVKVPDDDIIKCMKSHTAGLTKAFGKFIDNVMLEHEKITACHKDYLDDKSKKPEYPHVLWIQPPMHNNFRNNMEREQFGQCVDRMCKFHDGISRFAAEKNLGWNRHDIIHQREQ